MLIGGGGVVDKRFVWFRRNRSNSWVGCSHKIDEDKTIRVYSEIGSEFNPPTEQQKTVSGLHVWKMLTISRIKSNKKKINLKWREKKKRKDKKRMEIVAKCHSVRKFPEKNS